MNPPVPASRAVQLALCAALAAVGVALAYLQPGVDARQPRFEQEAGIGERVTTSGVVLSVTDVTVARRLTQNITGVQGYGTQGLFVVVTLTAEAERETTTLRHSRLRDGSGRLYRAFRSDLNTFGNTAADPGYPLTGTLVFTVPRSALDDDLELVTAAQNNADAVWPFDRSYALGLDDPAVVRLPTASAQVLATYDVPLVNF